MFCENCGKDLSEGANFCSACGKPVNSELSKIANGKDEVQNEDKKTSAESQKVVYVKADKEDDELHKTKGFAKAGFIIAVIVASYIILDFLITLAAEY